MKYGEHDVQFDRYEIQGPKMNPVSVMTYKIWDKQTEDYVRYPNRGWTWEFLNKIEAEKQKELLDMDEEKRNGFNYNKVKDATRLLLEGIGDDPDRDGLKDTPDRVARMYEEILNGYSLDPADNITEFDNDVGYHGPVVLKNADFYTYCEHHLQLFAGKLNIAYKPADKIVGISKLVRISRVFAKRPQVQERLTKEIADSLNSLLNPQWVVVKIEAEHYCMSIRGVRVPGTITETIFGHGEYPEGIFRL